MEELATDWPDSYYGNKYLDRPDAATMLRPKTHVLEHTSLGNMTGVRYADTPEVVRYRGIPYATLPGRFKRSTLRDNLDGLSRDFTKPGYACPHTFEMDDVHSGGPYPGEKPIQTSEFDSLILEVNVPHSIEAPTPPGGYPVMVYIHGGAYVLGKIDAQHNTAYMAQHSVTLSEPVITVAIQYRLGALGFMATPDGSKNLGLWDQRNALLWVQKFIAGFDGNPSRVTLFGESAGGYSICCHMLSHQPSSGPLFNRVIIMSGVMGPLQIPLPEDEAGKAFEDICLDLGIEERGESAIKKLQSLDVETIVSASDAWNAKGNMWSPVDDPSFFKTKVTWDNVHYHLEDCAGVDDMIVGNTGFEGQAFLNVANSMTPASFLEYLKLELSNSAAKRIMEAYEITLDMDQNAFLTAAMCWIGDVVFNTSIHAFSNLVASQPTKRLYRYIFDIRNPFPNAPFYQQAHHWVDVYFLFRTLQFRYPRQYLKDLSNVHAAMWIIFANGRAPWKAFKEYDHINGGDASLIMVADERDEWVEMPLQKYERMSKMHEEHAETRRLDLLWRVWHEEKAGHSWLPLGMAALRK